MPNDIRDVIVRQGDCLASIAAAHGIGDERRILDHPDNRELFSLPGRRAGILLPGDVVAVPMHTNEHLVAAGDTLNVSVKLPRTTLRMKLTGPGGEVLANQRVLARLPGAPEPREYTSDGGGLLEIPVPPRAREVTLELPEIQQTLVVALGHMDPLPGRAGQIKRLANLGFLPPHAQATEDEFRTAVRRFREANHLAEGGADDAFQSELADEHGS
ncbi:MAG: hypothetical protein U0414_28845 [Polyangiaceae bacterium]